LYPGILYRVKDIALDKQQTMYMKIRCSCYNDILSKGVLEQVISRVLSRLEVTLQAAMIIHLGQQLPAASSDQPENLDGLSLSVLLFGLAPDGVYQAFPVTRKTGELLPHRFTLTPAGKPDEAVYFLWHFP